jgi:primosomal protein N' (replication factor Y)
MTDNDPTSGSQTPQNFMELMITIEELISFQGKLAELSTIKREADLFEKTHNVINSHFPISFLQVILWNTDTGAYYAAFTKGGSVNLLEDGVIDTELISWVLGQETPSTITVREPWLDDPGVRSLLIAPLPGKTGPMGVLVMGTPIARDKFSTYQMSIVKVLCRQAGFVLDNIQLSEHIQSLGNLLDNILESVPHAVIATGGDDRILACNKNAEFMFGFKRIMALGEPFQEVLPGNMSAAMGSIIVQTLTAKKTVDYEIEHNLPDGTPITVGVTTSLLYNKEFKPEGVVFMCRDMTLSREVLKLRELDKMKSEFVQTVSHELKTPLTTIIGGTDILMMDKELLSDEHLEVIGIITSGAHRLQALISDLLDLSRLESGDSIKLDMERVSLRELIEASITVAKGKGEHAFSVDIPVKLPPLFIDRAKIKQVFDNIIGNAVKYSPQGGTVTVAVQTDSKEALVTVADEGLGIIPLDREFDYAVPPAITGEVAPGKRLLVPFGKAEKTAYCISLPDKSEFEKLRSVISVLDEEPLIDANMIELTRWMADYYAVSHGEALDAALPRAVKKPRSSRKQAFASLAADWDETGKRIAALTRKPTPQQLKLLDVLREKAQSGIEEVYIPLLRDLAGVGPSAVKSLARARLIRIDTRTLPAGGVRFYSSPEPGESSIDLSAEQETALDQIRDAIAAGGFHAILLHGVTGSGKTEIYLRALKETIASGAQGIVLVPEIALTPQTVSRFSSRFDDVVILHSAQTDRERRDAWRKAKSGEAQVVVGPRSAVFAPVKKLGLIIVDEEHEGSFKQESTPRYHGRDAAVMRAKLLGIPVILGSATPALESLYNAQQKKYAYIPLRRRVTRWSLPPVKIIDMKTECREQRRFVLFAHELVSRLERVLAKKEQAILLINRRGFHTTIACTRCGYVMKCRWCDVALTYHRGRDKAVCHYCGDEREAPSSCPECGMAGVTYSGTGTERVLTELAGLFPSARFARMDSDTMHKRADYEKTLFAFARGDVDVLVGTQMIAKGLDFPRVTLVCALMADGGLRVPDFRAAERTFQLLVQVAGRAGRGDAPGSVYLQAFEPEHYAISAAARHDYAGFAKKELAFRRMWEYPPYVKLARFVIQGPDIGKVQARSNDIADKLKAAQKNVPGSKVLGPAPCPIAQVKGSHRMHVLVKSPTPAGIREMIKAAGKTSSTRGVLRISIDVDPLSIL